MPGAGLQRQTKEISVDDDLLTWVEAFLVARKSENLTLGSIQYHREKLANFLAYCDGQVITRLSQLTPDNLRRYLVHLADTGHNSGGVAGFYRSLKAFLRWYENEAEPDGWQNPIQKVKPPRIDDEPLAPVELDIVMRMVDACPPNTFTGLRDRALFLFMLDTGCRAMEVLSLNLEDLNPITGEAYIRHSKARRPRSVFLGKKARKAFRAYLKRRQDNHPAAWLSSRGNRLTQDGLRQALLSRATRAGVRPPSPHSFRRAFCLSMLRNGCDLVTLARLMGHKGLTVLQKYLRQMSDDMRAAHQRSGPVDHFKPKGGDYFDPD